MSNGMSRPGLAVPKRLDYQTTNFHRRPSFSTSAKKISTSTCGHSRPVVRNVVEIDGPVAYICRSCFAHLRAVEFKAIVRRQVAKLFRNWWPSRSLGRAVDWLLARAMLAAFRDRNHKPWIQLARIAARIAEGRAVWQ